MERNDRNDREARHDGTVEEWLFTAWTGDGALGLLSGHRVVGRRAWYWAALARADRELLHIADFDVPVRADPFIVKGEALWAEHRCDAPMEQWSIGNETYASALADADEALGRAYGHPTPIAFDLEWYATAAAEAVTDDGLEGYRQAGVVHGIVEVLGEPTVELEEIPAARWHRWTSAAPDGGSPMAPVELPTARAHAGVRAPFAFPDGTLLDLVLTPDGWRTRRAGR